MKFYMFFLFLCPNWNVMRADVTSDFTEGTLNLSYTGEGYLVSPPSNCSLLLDSFADYAMNFTKCSIKHARPVRLCEKCIDHYVDFTSKYQELLNTEDNGTTCRSIFFSHDRLDVVLQFYNSIMNVWDEGNCNACFTWNGTTPSVSNSTEIFNKKLNDTIKCINDNNSTANNTEVCEKCMQWYIQLDEHYKSLSSDKIGVYSICMDIVDSMNATRLFWSKSLGCCKLRKSPETIFLACSIVISFLPLLYYLAVRYGGPIRELPNVMKQSRYKQRLMRTGRIN